MRAAALALRALPQALPRPPVTLSPRARLRLAGVLALGLALVSLYVLWFRDSSLVRVEKVTVTGLSVDDAPRIRAALTEAGRRMTTLHVHEQDLEHAVAGYATVHELRVSTDFPHGLRIHVVERRPVAVLVSGGQRVPVAADGIVLRGVRPVASLPPVRVSGGLPRRRLGERDAMTAVSVIAAAPSPMAARIEQVKKAGLKGLVADLREGPEVILGDSRRLRAKWAAATRVLADPAAQGAAYVDVRLPERPVVGGLPPEPGAAGAPEAAAGPPGTPAAPQGGAPQAGTPQPGTSPVPPANGTEGGTPGAQAGPPSGALP
jgi:cell division protein FtsQ